MAGFGSGFNGLGGGSGIDTSSIIVGEVSTIWSLLSTCQKTCYTSSGVAAPTDATKASALCDRVVNVPADISSCLQSCGTSSSSSSSSTSDFGMSQLTSVCSIFASTLRQASGSRSSGPSTGAIIAIVVVVILVVIVAAALFVWWYRRSRQRSQSGKDGIETASGSPKLVESSDVQQQPGLLLQPLPQQPNPAAYAGALPTKDPSYGGLFAQTYQPNAMQPPVPAAGLWTNAQAANEAGFSTYTYEDEMRDKAIIVANADKLPAAPYPGGGGSASAAATSVSKDVMMWSVEEVAAWLTSQSYEFEVCEVFRQAGMDGRALLAITDEILLNDLGIKKLGTRLSLRQAVDSLRASLPAMAVGQPQRMFSVNQLPPAYS